MAAHNENKVEQGFNSDLPPGLHLAGAEPMEGVLRKDDKVDSICKEVLQRTDELLQEKVDQMLTSAQQNLQESFDQQQGQLNSSIETELLHCREKVKSLEADKQEMQRTVLALQEQLNAISMQFYRPCGYPPMSMGGSPLPNAGMMGPFSTRPSGFPLIPGFPTTEQAPSETGEVSTTAPASPLMTPGHSASEPPTPLRCPPPAMPVPPPPPGLSPPPGLTDQASETPVRTSAPISLSAAIDASTPVKTAPVLAEKAKQTPEDLHRQALELMMKSFEKNGNHKDAADPSSLNLTPKPTTPRSPLTTLNLTPKRTPRLSRGSLTPGMKSPAVTASPYVICESGGSVFGFTIRKADDCTLGLDASYSDNSNFLTVTGVKAGGAMQAWNKQCVGGPAAGKAVMPGDKIVKVNNMTTPAEMLQECRDQKLLRFTVQRGEVDEDFDPCSLQSWGVAQSSH